MELSKCQLLRLKWKKSIPLKAERGERKAHIDTLRGLSILSVILYHVSPDLFPGGALGVDAFFVISGFIITSVIWDPIKNGSFSLRNFYQRRAFRLIPPLIPLLISTLICSLLILTPQKLYEMSQAVGASLFFVSNLYFFREMDYFGAVRDGASPVLHLWSLGIEEQFYLLFPFLLLLIRRLRYKLILTSLTLVSFFAFALLGSNQYAREAFFLLPFRFWELSFGSLAYFFAANISQGKLNRFRNWDFIPLLCFIWSIVLFRNELGSFFYNLMICLCTAILLIVGETSILMQKCSNIKTLQLIGRASYSIYLWHLPPLFFLRSMSGNHDLPWFYLMVSLGISISLGLLSWILIEQKIKKMSVRTVWTFIIIIPVSFSAILIAAVFLTKGLESNYYSSRLSAQEAGVFRIIDESIKPVGKIEIVESECRFNIESLNEEIVYRIKKCNSIFGKALVITGDSHSYNFFNLVTFALPERPFVLGFLRGGCRIGDSSTSSICQYKLLNTFLSEHPKIADQVIYHQSGSHLILDKYGRGDSNLAFLRNSRYSFDLDKIRLVSDELLKMSKYAQIFWFGPFVEPRINLLDKRNFREDLLVVSPSNFLKFEALDLQIAKLVAGESDVASGVEPVSYISILQDMKLEPNSKLIVDKCLLFKDTDHISKCGERLLGLKIRGLLFKWLR
jgi:peptidoglycan/LPS O-acetylase OafA/YrhL